jgi:plasmid stabilization system protein ParE
MPKLIFSPRALLDMERLTLFLRDNDAHAATDTVPALLRGLGILKEHPLVGRKAEAGMRELVMARGKAGYIALYDFDVANDRVIVEAIRHQREEGYIHE